MNILRIGGTGFISSKLVEKLLSKGHKLTLLNRGKTKNELPNHPNLSFAFGDRNDTKILSELGAKQKFDVVYDMIAYDEKDYKSAIDAFKNRIGRFIHCSTISVYMLAKEVKLPVTEEQINLPLMKEFKRSPFGWDYGILPATAVEGQQVQGGRIVATGPGDPVVDPSAFDGEPWRAGERAMKHRPMQSQVGDHAIFFRKAAVEITFGDHKYLVVPHAAILVLLREGAEPDATPW